MSSHRTQGLKRVLGAALGVVLAIASVASAVVLPASSGAAAAENETREGFVVLLAQALAMQPASGATQVFSDVPPSDPDFGYIMAASQAGWISGFPGGIFRPDGTLTREQMAKVEILALGLQAQAQALGSQTPTYQDAGSIGRWAWGYVNEASAIGILQGFADGSFGPTSTFTSAQATDALTQLQAYLKTHERPVVTAVSPASGSTAGGTTVAIIGSGFTGTTAVHFGTAAAASFTVNSDTSITAVSPAGTGAVDVTVTTPNGTSATGPYDLYAYAAPASSGGGVVTLVPTKITATPNSPKTVTAGGPETVTFTVTNQYGGVMSGETVNLGVTGTLSRNDLSPTAGTTNGNGEVTVTYNDSTAGDSGTVTGTVSGYTSVTTATAILTVANSGVTITGSSSGSTTSSSTPATAGGASSNTPDTSASATGGTGSVTVLNFTGNPGPVTGAFSSAGTYFDVSLSTSNTFNGVTIEQCSVSSSSLLYWFGGTTWSAVSPTTYSGGCLTFTASNSSSPTIAQLTGTPFAVATSAPALSPAPTAAASTAVVGDTTITATAASGDTLTVQVSSTNIATPVLGSAAPTFGVTTDYTSGADLTAASGDYVGVYDVNSSGNVVAFSEITLTSGEIAAAAPALSPAPTAAASTDVVGDTTITATAASGDTLTVEVSSTSIATPRLGSLAPAGAGVTANYGSGADLGAAAGDYIGVYEVDASGNVEAFSAVGPLSQSQLGSLAPDLGTSPTVEASTLAVGDTTVTATPAIGDTLTVDVSASQIATPVLGSTAPTSGAGVIANYSPGADLAASPGDYVAVYDVTSGGKVTAFSLVGPLDQSEVGSLAPGLSPAPTVLGSLYVAGDTTVNAAPFSGDTLTVDVSTSQVATPMFGSAAPTSGAGLTTDYFSGANLAANAGNYIGVYDVTGSGKVAAFSLIGPLTASVIAAPAPGLSPTPTAAASRDAVGDTTVTATPASGDTLTVDVSASQIATPVLGAPLQWSGPNPTVGYTSGADLKASLGDYVGVYDVNSSGKVVAFSEITLTSGEIAAAAPALSPAPTAAASTDVVGDTTITATAASGDTLTVQVSSSSIATPVLGSAAPTSGVTTDYTSGADLVAASGDYVGVYDVNSGDVVAFSVIGPLAASQIGSAAPGIMNAPQIGTEPGTTEITAGLNNPGDTFVADVVSSPIADPVLGSTPPAGATAYTSDENISVPVNQYVDVYELNTSGAVTAFAQVQIPEYLIDGIGNEVSTITAAPAYVAADGVSTATITVTLKDSNGNSIQGAVVQLLANNQDVLSTVTTDNYGQAIFSYALNTSEPVTFTALATYDGGEGGVSGSASVTFADYLTSASYNSSNHQLMLYFSNGVKTTTLLTDSDFSVSVGSSLADITGTEGYPAVSANELVLILSGETILTGATINMAPNQTGIQDGNGYPMQPAATPITIQ